MDTLIKVLVKENFAPERILPDAPMSRYTTFRVGGKADVLVNIASAKEISIALTAARKAGVPVTVIGNGSNLIVRDGGIRGLVLRICGSFSEIQRDGDVITAQSGALISACAQFALREGLDGLAELAGIPGTIGGGVIMNAGSYGGELSQVVTRVDAVSFHTGEPRTYTGDALGFGYRTSALMHEDIVVTGVTMQLRTGDPDAIRARMDDLARQRREKQPLEYPSAGSTFKRPEGLFAAKLIDDCGLRGMRIGGAQVSAKHAGFIVNTGDATAEDILNLMAIVRKRVLDDTGVLLDPEVRILGEDA
ncbi:MAG: UDP-N-acetylmuramate dehydrogenase [Clostridia bacterium]|nr:UDP-N-acetylmuramate dehydrogenase [Clostridia bacterium]